jgi:hypothetical protein
MRAKEFSQVYAMNIDYRDGGAHRCFRSPPANTDSFRPDGTLINEQDLSHCWLCLRSRWARCFYLPWSGYWEQNYFLSHFPSLMPIVLHPSFEEWLAELVTSIS